MNEKMNAKDAGLRMEGMSEMAEWQRRAEKVKIDKELIDVRMELFDISSRIEAWERKAPKEFVDQVGCNLNNLAESIWSAGDCLFKILTEKMKYDIFEAQD